MITLVKHMLLSALDGAKNTLFAEIARHMPPRIVNIHQEINSGDPDVIEARTRSAVYHVFEHQEMN